jgi:hypothetical protein
MVRTLTLAALLVAAAAPAADPAPDTKQLDTTLIATLREVHDRGADLYNQSQDYSGAFRLYQGSLLTVRPLIGHRADVQKLIDDSLAAAGKEPDVARRAFLLHEAIEKVRAELKGATPKKETTTPSPMPKPKTDTVPKPMDPVPLPKKEPAPMPKPKTETVPQPKSTDPMVPKKDTETKTATVTGKVTVNGKPLAEGTVTFVSLDQKAPKVATATLKDGAYMVKDVPAGKYAVAVSSKTAGAVPAKFGTTDTSGLTFTVAAGANSYDIELK